MWLDEKSQCFNNFAAFPVHLQGNKMKFSRSCFDRSQLIIIVTLRGNVSTLLARLKKETDKIEASLFFFSLSECANMCLFQKFWWECFHTFSPFLIFIALKVSVVLLCFTSNKLFCLTFIYFHRIHVTVLCIPSLPSPQSELSTSLPGGSPCHYHLSFTPLFPDIMEKLHDTQFPA